MMNSKEEQSRQESKENLTSSVSATSPSQSTTQSLSDLHAKYLQKKKRIADEVTALIANNSIEDLVKRFFKDFGCINFASDEFMHELELARDFHAYHKGKYPDMHNEHETVPYRCYHKTVCKCGFSEAYDSGD